MLRAGDSFGEAELLEGAPRPSTVRASTDVLALRLDAADFRELVDAQPDIRTLPRAAAQARDGLQAFFRHVPAFARLPPAAVAAVVLAELEPIVAERGRDASTGRAIAPAPMYLIEEGRLRVLRTTGGPITWPHSVPARRSVSCRRYAARRARRPWRP